MRTPILLFFLFIFSINVFPQQIPVLTDSDMVNQSDFGKKIGWCKIKLDANFRVTTKESETKYEYYKFTTSGLSLFFEHKGNLTAVYKNENTDAKATLLDGIVDFYDPQMHLVNRYFFKNGFLIKELYFGKGFFGKRVGSIPDAFEYYPFKRREESYLCTFNRNGNVSAAGHMTYYGGKKIGFDNVWHPVSPELEIADGWYRQGYDSYKYFIGRDSLVGKNVMTIRSIDKNARGHGRVEQNCSAEKFRGKRIRFSGYIKPNLQTAWAGMGLIVNGATNKVICSTRNDLKETADWTKIELVMDIPDDAVLMNYWFQLEGRGQVWFKDFKFEVVDESVPLSKVENYPKNENKLLKEPVNLDFEK